ncbi:hypothetical protein KKD61_04340 [Patescibacteria group bacterium]|nr:hypothetical protein [Patescibacteria group bacterium]
MLLSGPLEAVRLPIESPTGVGKRNTVAVSGPVNPVEMTRVFRSSIGTVETIQSEKAGDRQKGPTGILSELLGTRRGEKNAGGEVKAPTPKTKSRQTRTTERRPQTVSLTHQPAPLSETLFGGLSDLPRMLSLDPVSVSPVPSPSKDCPISPRAASEGLVRVEQPEIIRPRRAVKGVRGQSSGNGNKRVEGKPVSLVLSQSSGEQPGQRAVAPVEQVRLFRQQVGPTITIPEKPELFLRVVQKAQGEQKKPGLLRRVSEIADRVLNPDFRSEDTREAMARRRGGASVVNRRGFIRRIGTAVGAAMLAACVPKTEKVIGNQPLSTAVPAGTPRSVETPRPIGTPKVDVRNDIPVVVEKTEAARKPVTPVQVEKTAIPTSTPANPETDKPPTHQERVSRVIDLMLDSGEAKRVPISELKKMGAGVERREPDLPEKLRQANSFLGNFGIHLESTHWDLLNLVEQRYQEWLDDPRSLKIDPTKEEIDALCQQVAGETGLPSEAFDELLHLIGWRESGLRGKKAKDGHGDIFRDVLDGITNPFVYAAIDSNEDGLISPDEERYWAVFLPKRETSLPLKELDENYQRVAAFKVSRVDPKTGREDARLLGERILPVPGSFIVNDARANLLFGMAIALDSIIRIAADMNNNEGSYKQVYDYLLREQPEYLFDRFTKGQRESLKAGGKSLLDGRSLFFAMVFANFHYGRRQFERNILYGSSARQVLSLPGDNFNKRSWFKGVTAETSWGDALKLAVWSLADPQWKQARYIGPGYLPGTKDDRFYYNVGPEKRERLSRIAEGRVELADLEDGETPFWFWQENADLFYQYLFRNTDSSEPALAKRIAASKSFFREVFRESIVLKQDSLHFPWYGMGSVERRLSVFDQSIGIILDGLQTVPKTDQERKLYINALFGFSKNAEISSAGLDTDLAVARFDQVYHKLGQLQELHSTIPSDLVKAVRSGKILDLDNLVLGSKEGSLGRIKLAEKYAEIVFKGRDLEYQRLLIERIKSFVRETGETYFRDLDPSEKALLTSMAQNYFHWDRNTSLFNSPVENGVNVVANGLMYRLYDDLFSVTGENFHSAKITETVLARFSRGRKILAEMTALAETKVAIEKMSSGLNGDQLLRFFPPVSFEISADFELDQLAAMVVTKERVSIKDVADDKKDQEGSRVMLLHRSLAALQVLSSLEKKFPDRKLFFEEARREILEQAVLLTDIDYHFPLHLGGSSIFNKRHFYSPRGDYHRISDRLFFWTHPLLIPAYLADQPPKHFDIETAWRICEKYQSYADGSVYAGFWEKHEDLVNESFNAMLLDSDKFPQAMTPRIRREEEKVIRSLKGGQDLDVSEGDYLLLKVYYLLYKMRLNPYDDSHLSRFALWFRKKRISRGWGRESLTR